jgi:hypothetical protein
MLDDITGDRVARHYPDDGIPIIMTVYTRAPEKWLLVDRETGQVYQGNDAGSWDRLDPTINEKKRAANAKRIQSK